MPVISAERVQELRRKGSAIDGFEDIDPSKNARVAGRGYRRESPPLSPDVRAALDKLETVHTPADPGIYYLWDGGRIVFVGKSRMGLMGAHLCASVEVHARAGSLVKKFDRLSFQPFPEDSLDGAILALVWWLAPKHNRLSKYRQDPTARTRFGPVLERLGFPVNRAA
jgi:hypothetical protein